MGFEPEVERRRTPPLPPRRRTPRGPPSSSCPASRGRSVGWLVDGPVHDDGHPHVGVRLQTEGDDGHADEEHRHYGHHLQGEHKTHSI
ncbi:hypothetical protein CDAR_509771 [Caerostris darwini]|uniref:Uncharacterized protein n=1 Tax=Caerostris darwini TaxID=1538125 RepID=A0AAV4QJP1_9ARAC|nr:hypothetical protein CDAR_509771 [Caerostris darwini]